MANEKIKDLKIEEIKGKINQKINQSIG